MLAIIKGDTLRCPKCGSNSVVRINVIEAVCTACKFRSYDYEFMVLSKKYAEQMIEGKE